MRSSEASGSQDHPYKDPHLSIAQRVEDLLGRMTLEDKAGMMFHAVVASGEPLHSPHPLFGSPSAARMVVDLRLNHFNVFAEGGPSDPRTQARWHNELQRLAAAQPLGIPVTLSSDPRHHFVENPFTSSAQDANAAWPEPIGLAAIGSERVVEEFADILRQEYLALGLRVGLHPQIDLATEPRWGRISGTFGEDAELTSRLSRAYIRGLQGTELGKDSVALMAKHFPGGGPQKDGDDPHVATGSEQVYPGKNFEYHLQPFSAAIDAGVSQVMPSYGVPVGTEFEEVGFAFNRSVITEVLRNRLGFDGIVCTDWAVITGTDGMEDLSFLPKEFEGLTAAKAWGVETLTPLERVQRAIEAGVDQFGGELQPELIVKLVRGGRVSESRIDQSIRRLLREKFALGLFDDPYVDESAAPLVVRRPEHVAAARNAQETSLTLLKNAPGPGGELLPFRRPLRLYVEGLSPAIIGDRARVVDDLCEADAAILRVKAPRQRSRVFPSGSLEFPLEETSRIRKICTAVPTVLDVYLDRPAVLTPFEPVAAAIIANYGVSEMALLSVLFGDAEPQGSLPFDLPRSDVAIESSRSDVPFDTQDPLFRFGHGLRYHE